MRVRGIPTLGPVLEGAGRALRRFPLVIAAAALATLAAILLAVEHGDEQQVQRLLVAGMLGIPLFLAVPLITERLQWRAAARWGALGAAAGVLMGWYMLWPQWSEPLGVMRALQLGAVFVLFVSVAPFLVGAEGRSFWEYDRTLFERAVTALIYSHVLFAGVAIALLALEKLFGLDVPGSAYLRLWDLAFFLFTPWFFVAGVPADPAGLPATVYPRGLRAFTRFALLPIVGIYLLILTAYFAKVLATWVWPSGWIGWLVSVVAVAGIFSLLLVHPIAGDPGDRWVGTYALGFYALLLPAIVMLWLAIYQRVAQYGVTEPRYFLTVLSLWLAGIAVHQLVTRSRGIRIIPASLAVVGLLTFGGPWSAYWVSERSQVDRLAGVLTRHGLLDGDRVQPATDSVPEEDRREIGAVLEYLGRTHGYGGIAGWFPDSMRATGGVLANLRSRRDPAFVTKRLMAALGLKPAPPSLPGGAFRYAARAGEGPLPVTGLDFLLRVGEWSAASAPAAGWATRGDSARAELEVWRDGERVAVFDLGDLLRGLRRADVEPRSVPAVRLRVDQPGPGVLYLRSVSGHWDGERPVIQGMSADVLLRAPAGR